MSKDSKDHKYGYIIEIIVLAIVVLVVRMLFESVLPLFYERLGQNFYHALLSFLRNYPLTLLMLIWDFFLIRILTKKYQYGEAPMTRALFELLGIVLIGAISAVLMQLSYSDGPFFSKMLLMKFITSTIFNIVVVAIIDIFSYNSWKSNKALAFEIKMRSQANYQYQLLKGQLNPHFLFNSLNVLDYLIHIDTERASDYVKKLSNVYRYQLNMEAQTTVTLDEEINFVSCYVALLKERFTEGLDVKIDVDKQYLRRKIVPCGLQIMIENAVKHNIVSFRNPLVVNVFIEDDNLIVKNNINLKVQSNPKTGTGLENIKKQYQILFNSTITIENNGKVFFVRIPLFR
ncbi:MAG: histidine kinase [Bacteroidales bacterium]|jgi:sensor histidine kinase YesM